MAVGAVECEVVGDGGPGALVVDGLEPGTAHDVRLDGRRVGSCTTLPSLGAERCRVAVLTDLHIGEPHFGAWPRAEHPDPSAPPNERALRSGLDQALAWGAQALVLKGDLTETGRRAQWETFAEILRPVPVPVLATRGNHDVQRGAQLDRDLLRDAGVQLAVDDEVAALDLDGLRVLVADSTRHERHHGTPAAFADEVVRRAGEAAAEGRAALVAFHHQAHALPLRVWWPPGMWGASPGRFLDRLAAANPRTVVSTGHTHSHRRRQRGSLVVSETGSTKDGLGAWTGYVFAEGGVRQVTRRVSGPAEQGWTDATGRVLFGVWGRWSPGRLADRCFIQRW